MVCIGKNIANCSKNPHFLCVMCALCPRYARCACTVCALCTHAPMRNICSLPAFSCARCHSNQWNSVPFCMSHCLVHFDSWLCPLHHCNSSSSFVAEYYYTPLLLNLANKQASKQASKQARHASILVVTPSQHLGSFPNLAIVFPQWCPCQIQVLSPKLTGGAPGQGRQVGRCPPKTAHFVPQNSLFWPKTAPKPTQNGQTNGNGGYTAHAPRLPRDEELFVAL